MYLIILVLLHIALVTCKSLTLLSPASGTQWFISQSYEIQWSSSGLDPSANITIELWQDNLLFDDHISTPASSTPNSGSFLWTIPNDIIPGDAYYIYLYSGSTKVQGSDFAIGAPGLHIISPSQGMKFAVGGNVVITWASEGISDTFTIVLYSQNMFVLTIASNVPNTGSYTWAAPANLSASGNYSLTISATNVNIQASSDMFTLTTDRPDTLTILTGESGHLVLAYFSDETYASGVMQSSYLFPYNGRCSTWDKQVEYQFQTYAKYSVYQSSALSALVLSFKGSDSVQDFLADGNAPFDTCNFGAQACGQVHQGFYGYYNQVRDSIFTTLAQETGYFDLYVTGHSLGAALAMLAAFGMLYLCC